MQLILLLHYFPFIHLLRLLQGDEHTLSIHTHTRWLTGCFVWSSQNRYELEWDNLNIRMNSQLCSCLSSKLCWKGYKMNFTSLFCRKRWNVHKIRLNGREARSSYLAACAVAARFYIACQLQFDLGLTLSPCWGEYIWLHLLVTWLAKRFHFYRKFATPTHSPISSCTLLSPSSLIHSLHTSISIVFTLTHFLSILFFYCILCISTASAYFFLHFSGVL